MRLTACLQLASWKACPRRQAMVVLMLPVPCVSPNSGVEEALPTRQEIEALIQSTALGRRVTRFERASPESPSTRAPRTSLKGVAAWPQGQRSSPSFWPKPGCGTCSASRVGPGDPLWKPCVRARGVRADEHGSVGRVYGDRLRDAHRQAWGVLWDVWTGGHESVHRRWHRLSRSLASAGVYQRGPERMRHRTHADADRSSGSV